MDPDAIGIVMPKGQAGSGIVIATFQVRARAARGGCLNGADALPACLCLPCGRSMCAACASQRALAEL